MGIPGNTPAAASGSEFGYIEVIEDCVCIGEKCQKTSCHIPKSLSVGDYAEMERYNFHNDGDGTFNTC